MDRFECATDPVVFECAQPAWGDRRVADEPGADRLYDENIGKSGRNGLAADLRVAELAGHEAQRVFDRGRSRERVATDEHHGGKRAHQLSCGGFVERHDTTDQLRCSTTASVLEDRVVGAQVLLGQKVDSWATTRIGFAQQVVAEAVRHECEVSGAQLD